MSVIKEFFDKLKRNKSEASGVQKVEPKAVEPTLTVFDNSGYEAEKQKAIQELVKIQNGGEFSFNDVCVLTKEITLPNTKLMVGTKETTLKELLSDKTDLLEQNLKEFVVLKPYASHRAVALLMDKNVITDNVHYETYYPEDESTVQIVVNGASVNNFVSVEDACKNRWAGKYFFYDYSSWKSGNRPKLTLSSYNNYVQQFAESGDAVTMRTFENLFSGLVFNMTEQGGASVAQMDKVVDCFAEQVLNDVNNYANNNVKVTEYINESAERFKHFARHLTEKQEKKK